MAVQAATSEAVGIFGPGRGRDVEKEQRRIHMLPRRPAVYEKRPVRTNRSNERGSKFPSFWFHIFQPLIYSTVRDDD